MSIILHTLRESNAVQAVAASELSPAIDEHPVLATKGVELLNRPFFKDMLEIYRPEPGSKQLR
jgi:hypothetical protein